MTKRRVFVAWDEMVNGSHVAVLREVLPKASAVSFGSLVTLGPDASYPVLAPTSRGLLAVWTTGDEAARIATRLVEIR